MEKYYCSHSHSSPQPGFEKWVSKMFNKVCSNEQFTMRKRNQFSNKSGSPLVAWTPIWQVIWVKACSHSVCLILFISCATILRMHPSGNKRKSELASSETSAAENNLGKHWPECFSYSALFLFVLLFVQETCSWTKNQELFFPADRWLWSAGL